MAERTWAFPAPTKGRDYQEPCPLLFRLKVKVLHHVQVVGLTNGYHTGIVMATSGKVTHARRICQVRILCQISATEFFGLAKAPGIVSLCVKCKTRLVHVPVWLIFGLYLF
jgi:hypothetical protein